MSKRSCIFAIALIAGVMAISIGGRSQATVVVAGTLVTLDGDNDGFLDDATIDRVTFDVTAGAFITFDILADEAIGFDLNGDNELTRLNTFIRLFVGNAPGHPIAPDGNIGFDDNGALGSDGSISTFDSILNFGFQFAGTYFLTIEDRVSGFAEAIAGIDLDHTGLWASAGPGFATDHADWQLTLTPQEGEISNVFVTAHSAIPEPTTIALFALGLLGLGAARRRRHHHRT